MRIDLGDTTEDAATILAKAKVVEATKKAGPPPSKFKKWLMKTFPSFFKNSRIS